jgi:hypothetical protein
MPWVEGRNYEPKPERQNLGKKEPRRLCNRLATWEEHPGRMPIMKHKKH